MKERPVTELHSIPYRHVLINVSKTHKPIYQTLYLRSGMSQMNGYFQYRLNNLYIQRKLETRLNLETRKFSVLLKRVFLFSST